MIKSYPKLFLVDDYYDLDKKQFTLKYKYIKQRKDSTGRKVRIEYPCDICQKIYITKLNDEMLKSNPWICRSCRTKLEWKRDDYRKSLTENNSNPDNLKRRQDRGRENMLVLWKNPDYRNKMLKKMNEGKDKFEFKLKNDDEFRKKFFSNQRGLRTEYTDRNGNIHIFRSKLEAKFAKCLDMICLDWEYEPKRFAIELHAKQMTYSPDFYIPKSDLWIEVKGFWRGLDKEKYEIFGYYEKINKKFFMTSDVKSLEILINENNFEEAIRYTTCI